MENRLNQWFGGYAITEYPSSGHELDCYSVTYEGIKILVEVIWTSTRTQFFEDINIMMSNSANVKIAIVNPIILQKQDLVRHYKKISIAEAEKGYLLSELIDGKRILGEENYLDSEIRNHIFH